MNEIGLAINSRGDTSDEEIIAISKLADDLGYHSFWTSESWGRDAFTILAMIACHTENIRLATGIVNTYSRTPALLAQTIASLDIISKGRAILGLGSSGKVVVEGWHGVPFDSPLARTREYIEIIRKALPHDIASCSTALAHLCGQPRPQELGADRRIGRRLAASLGQPGKNF